jgi:hypothetical protein
MTRPLLSARTPRASVKLFDGTWVIYRKAAAGFSRTVGGNRMPRFKHQSFESAQAEAERLAAIYPESLFIILQERASVRMKQALPEHSPRLGTPGETVPNVSPGPSSAGRP